MTLPFLVASFFAQKTKKAKKGKKIKIRVKSFINLVTTQFVDVVDKKKAKKGKKVPFL